MSHISMYSSVLIALFTLVSLGFGYLWLYSYSSKYLLIAYQTPHVNRNALEALIVDLLAYRRDVILRSNNKIREKTHYLLQHHLEQYLAPSPSLRGVVVWWWASVLEIRYRQRARSVSLTYQSNKTHFSIANRRHLAR